jgi:hypothetical protein
VAGWVRLVSPLTWQAERGLQIEAVAATPAMVGWVFRPERYEIAFTEHHAYEVVGPGTGGLLTASTVLSLMAVAIMVALWVLAFRHGHGLTSETVSWLALAAVGLFVVTSKVLSPQYLLWLLPLAAAAAGLSRGRALVVWSAGLLVVTAATQVVFPELYGEDPPRGKSRLGGARAHGPQPAAAGTGRLGCGRVGPRGQRGRALERQPPGPCG